jgi:hypothetical protein
MALLFPLLRRDVRRRREPAEGNKKASDSQKVPIAECGGGMDSLGLFPSKSWVQQLFQAGFLALGSSPTSFAFPCRRAQWLASTPHIGRQGP